MLDGKIIANDNNMYTSHNGWYRHATPEPQVMMNLGLGNQLSKKGY